MKRGSDSCDRGRGELRSAAARDILVERVAEIRGTDRGAVQTDVPLADYGVTSTDAVSIAGELEEATGCPLSPTLLWEHPTIDRLCEALAGERTAEVATTASWSPDRRPTAEPPSEAAEDTAAVAVVGAGCRFPGATGIAGFDALLAQGQSAIREVPQDRWEHYDDGSPDVTRLLAETTRRGGFLDDIHSFDTEFFGIAQAEAEAMDPQQRILLEVAREALEHAAIPPARLGGGRTGVFVGASSTEYGHLTMGDLSRVEAWSAPGAALSIIANRLSYLLDLRGPSMTIDTACSSSLAAVHTALRALRAGECDTALTGGVNVLLSPAVTISFDRGGGTSPDGTCRAFDAAANGMVRGEGCGVLVLKRLTDAQRDGDRVHAVLRGSAINSDGRSSGLVAPNPGAQQDVLRAACADARVEPAAIGYVEAHGTGTPLGDPIEASALSAVLSRHRPTEHPLLIGSVKANIGHLEAAAGIAGLIKAVLAVRTGAVPATPNFTEPSPHIDFAHDRLEVVDRHRQWPDQAGQPRVAGVSSFGFGGTNAHVIVEQPPEEPPADPKHTARDTDETTRAPEADAVRTVALTDISAARVSAHATQLADWLESPEADGVTRDDVARTLSRRFGRGQVGSAVLAADTNELVTGLRALAEGQDSPHVVAGPARTTAGRWPVWVFSGFGSGLPSSVGGLRFEEPAFASAVDHLDPILRDEVGTSLSDMLDNHTDADAESGTVALPLHLAQPAIFGVQLALARLWAGYGVRPAAVVGHSMGEVAAAVVAGALTEREGARVIAVRSALLESLGGIGAMALAEITATEATDLLHGYPDVHVAVYSAPDQTVVTGDTDQIAHLVERCGNQGRFATVLRTPGAGHSPGVDPVLPWLRERLASLVGREPAIGFYSTVHEESHKAPECDAGYWAENLRSPVRFTQAIAAAAADGHAAFTEISAHPLVTHSIVATVGDDNTLVTPTLRRDQGHRELHRSLARLRLAGHAVHDETPGRIACLPPPPWQRNACLPPPPRRETFGAHPLLGTPTGIPGEDRLVASADIGTTVLPWLAPEVPGGREEHPPILEAGHVAETALAAGAHALHHDTENLTVASLELDRMLPLGDHTHVTTTVRVAGEQMARVEMHARDAAGAWQRHAAALVTADTGETDPEIHETSGPGTVEIVLRNAPPVTREPRIPPALLAACITAAAPADSRENRHIAVEAAGVRLWPRDPARGADGSVRARVTPGPHDGEVTIADQEGQLLARVGGVAYRAVRPDTVPTPLDPKLFAAEWVTEPPPEPEAGARPGRETRFSVVAPHPSSLTELIRGELATDDPASPGGTPENQSGRARNHARPAAPEPYREAGTGDAAQGDGGEHLVAVIDIPEGNCDPATAEDIMLHATRLVQDALARSPQPQRVWFVTRGTLPFGTARQGMDRHGSPTAACLRGLVRVLALEHPTLNATLVDIDAPDDATVAELARVELTSGATDDEVSWCDGIRRVARLAHAPLGTPPPTGPTTPHRPLARPGAAYIITGGYGGLGLAVTDLLARRGAERVVLSGRSGPSAEATAEIERIRGTGCAVEVVLGDIADDGTAGVLVAAAENGGTPLRGVVHAAGFLDDRLVSDIDDADLRRVFAPKTRGAWRLHEATLDAELDWWVAFSSAAALVGSPGQGTYAAANAWLDAFTQWRRANGLPATTINWGVWSGAGAAPRDVRGMRPFTSAEGLEALEALLGAGRDATGVVGFQPARTAATFPELRRVPFFSTVMSAADAAPTASDWPGPEGLRGRDPAQAWQLAARRLRDSVAGVLGRAPETVDRATPLVEHGLDSLAAIRIRSIVEHDFGVTLPAKDVLTGQTLADAETLLAGLLGLDAARDEQAQRDRSGGVTTARTIDPRDAAERLAARVVEEALDTTPIGVLDDLTALGATPAQFDGIRECLEAETGVRLDAHELFATPTVERLADVVRKHDVDAVASTSGLRVLQDGDDRPPLFLVHPAGGTTGVYRTLAQLLGTGQPVHGLERFTDRVGVAERAARYVRMIRDVWPDGPYLLGGWSFGGAVAYEMARQLTDAQAQVDLLVLLDAGIPRPSSGQERRQISAQRYADFAAYLERTYGRSVPVAADALARLDEDDQLSALLDSMERSGVNELLGPAILEHQWTSHVDTRALEDYDPDDGALFTGRTVLYRATQPTPWAVHDSRYDHPEEARGWDRRCADLRIVPVDSHHLNLLDPPAVARVARDLATLLQVNNRKKR